MEGTVEGDGSGAGRYTLRPTRISNEDILFCIDVGPESMVELKVAMSPNGRPSTRLDSIKQAILLFINAKLTINPENRFAFASLGKSASWLRKEFSSEVESAFAAFRVLPATSSSSNADLTSLFRVAAHEAKKSRAQNRLLRVILIYCRSSIRPHHQWPVNQKLFTLDVVYLHEKPGPDNYPQEVYNSLVDAVEHVSEYEGYTLETGQLLARILFRYMCMLLSHPQQRCPRDQLDIPKPLGKKLPAADSMTTDDSITVSGKSEVQNIRT
ncbi:hypothetical protein PRUPE_6G150100 [Prunus persica]|uniref:BRISC and BRCA1-A complex member 1 n=1 Tax=Prunus persica TaxID=3760 RepID=M5W1Y1_PRUPE|nr:uncharacterized protein LOC18775602 [Prunus persica]ONI01636.1 hypothetical protein PRUPE_6G150100 [Prunus persica]